MINAKLKEVILAWANDQGEEFYASDVAKKFKVSKPAVEKAMRDLHDERKLVHADGCEKCDA